MAEDFLTETLKSIGQFLGVDQGAGSIRENIIINTDKVKPVKQPSPVLPSVPEIRDIEDSLSGDFEDDLDLNIEFGRDPDFDFTLPSEKQQNKEWNDNMTAEAVLGIQNGTGGITVPEQESLKMHLESIKELENSTNKGLIYDGSQEVFKPFKSLEGQGPDKSMSDMEIGYGIKIPKKWLTDNKDNWPIIEGVNVNVKKGITKDQANVMVKNLLDDAYYTSEKKLNNWNEMVSNEKAYWADLTYNGGSGAIKKNPKALKAEKEGYTIEAIIKTLDFIKAGGKPVRGLLNRRISMYNQAALEVAGAPVIESYSFGKDIKVKFSSKLLTNKVSKKFAEKINNADGWYRVASGTSDKPITKKADDDFKFTS